MPEVFDAATENAHERAGGSRGGPRPRVPRGWLLRLLSALILTTVLTALVGLLYYAPWNSVDGAEMTTLGWSLMLFANPLLNLLLAWLTVRFGPRWARSGIFERRWNFAGFVLSMSLLGSVVGVLILQAVSMISAANPEEQIFGFAIVVVTWMITVLFSLLPLWALLSALLIGPLPRRPARTGNPLPPAGR